MSELASVPQTQFADFIFVIGHHTQVVMRQEVRVNGDHVVQYHAKEVLVGEIVYSRQYPTVWKIRKETL